MKILERKNSNEKGNLKDCKCSFSGTSFYTVDGRPVCPKCLGIDEDEEDDDQEGN